MCNGKCNSGCKGCASNADGQDYDPKQIASWINKYVAGGKLQGEGLQEAYVKTMVYLEENKLPFTEGAISAKAQELKVIINDPDYLSSKTEPDLKRKVWALVIIFGLIFLALYFLFKEEGIPNGQLTMDNGQLKPVDPKPLENPAPVQNNVTQPASNPVNQNIQTQNT